MAASPSVDALAHRPCRHPDLRLLPAFETPEACAQWLAWAEAERRAAGVEAERHGFGHELPLSAHPGLVALTERVEAVMGCRSLHRDTVRYRSCAAGQGHPPHHDDYEIDGAVLVATAMLVIEVPQAGGATEFPDAMPWPQAVAPALGQLLVWANRRPDGRLDPAALHQAAPVVTGRRGVLLWFVYLALADWQGLPESPRPTAGRPVFLPPGPGQVFTCVDDGVPEETVELLQGACAARGVLFRHLLARRFDFSPQDRLPPGSLLYTPAVSQAAASVQDYLVAPDVVTFFLGDPLFPCAAADRALARAGVTQPRALRLFSADPQRLAAWVERLGGYPVVLKCPGGEGGLGVLRADSPAALQGLVDYLVRGLGLSPWLMSWVPDALHVRVLVVGDRAVACYDNPTRENDFRSTPACDPARYRAQVPAELADVAVRATAAQGLAFGGVDLLLHASGRIYVLEVNFPCYFAQATLGGGVDVAGPMLDWLLDRAEAQARIV